MLAAGWRTGTDRYGLPPNTGTFAGSNRWFFYGRPDPGPLDLDAMEAAAADALARERWRADLDHWYRELAPRGRGREPGAGGRSTCRRSRTRGWPSTSSRSSRTTAAGRRSTSPRCPAREPPSVPCSARPRDGASAGERSSRSSSVAPRRRRRLRRSSIGSPPAFVDAGRAVGTDLADVEAVGGEARAALDELLTDYAWRSYVSDVVQPTLAERPEAIVAGIRAALARRPARPTMHRRPGRRCPGAGAGGGPGAVRRPPRVRARLAYGANDDNTTVLCGLPLGLVRRAVLELGRRLVAAGPDRRRRRRLRGQHRRAVRARDRVVGPPPRCWRRAPPPGEPRPRSCRRPSSGRRRRPRTWTSHPAPSGWWR